MVHETSINKCDITKWSIFNSETSHRQPAINEYKWVVTEQNFAKLSWSGTGWVCWATELCASAESFWGLVCLSITSTFASGISLAAIFITVGFSVAQRPALRVASGSWVLHLPRRWGFANVCWLLATSRCHSKRSEASWVDAMLVQEAVIANQLISKVKDTLLAINQLIDHHSPICSSLIACHWPIYSQLWMVHRHYRKYCWYIPLLLLIIAYHMKHYWRLSLHMINHYQPPQSLTNTTIINPIIHHYPLTTNPPLLSPTINHYWLWTTVSHY